MMMFLLRFVPRHCPLSLREWLAKGVQRCSGIWVRPKQRPRTTAYKSAFSDPPSRTDKHPRTSRPSRGSLHKSLASRRPREGVRPRGHRPRGQPLGGLGGALAPGKSLIKGSPL